jgi:hypothetical protein
MSELAELLERFRRGPEILAAAMTGAAGSEVDFAPEGKWNVRQITAHVADSELAGAMRMRQIIAEDNPTLQGYDQTLWASRLDYAKRKPSQSLDKFRTLRAESYELLKDLPPDTFERRGTHSERGILTLLDLLRIYADHAEKHAMQIRTVRAAFKEAKARTAQ